MTKDKMGANRQCLIWKLMGHGIFFYHLRHFAAPVGLLPPCPLPCLSFTTLHMAEDACCIRCSKFEANLIKCCCVLVAGQTERCQSTSWMSFAAWTVDSTSLYRDCFSLRQEYKWKGSHSIGGKRPFITINAHTVVYFDKYHIHHPAVPSTSSIILKVDNFINENSIYILYYFLFIFPPSKVW